MGAWRHMSLRGLGVGCIEEHRRQQLGTIKKGQPKIVSLNVKNYDDCKRWFEVQKCWNDELYTKDDGNRGRNEQ